MKIKKINSENTNFKSGLTRKIIMDIKSVDIAKKELEFAKEGIQADFCNSKTICANFAYASDILAEISNRYKLPFHYNPPAIQVYSNKDLIEKVDNASGFCIPDTKEIIKEKPAYIGGSIFMDKKINGLYINNLLTNFNHFVNWHPSSHFLSTTLHEWFHCIHINLILKNKGYEGDCPVLRSKYFKEKANGLDSINIQTNLFGIATKVGDNIGNYAVFSRSMLEVFAELMTKITAESLDKNLNVIKNPKDNIPKDFPEPYKKEIEKLLNI